MKLNKRVFDPFIALAIIVGVLGSALCQDEPGKGGMNVIVNLPGGQAAGVGIHVYRNGNEATFGGGSDPNKGGLCSFHNLVPGSYEIRVERSDRGGAHYAPQQIFGVAVSAGNQTEVPVALEQGLSLQTSGKIRISDLGSDPGKGRIDIVATDANRLPVGVGIHLFRNGNEAAFGSGSDPNKGGLCTFANVTPGVYELRVDRSERDGLHFAPKQIFGINITARSRTNCRVTIAEGRSLIIEGKIRNNDLGADPGRGRIDIIATDANHLPVGVGIHLYRGGNEAVFGTGTDPNMGGLCTIASVTPGIYEMRVDRSERDGLHYAPQQIFGISVVAGSRTTYNVNVVEGRTLLTIGNIRTNDLGADAGRGRLDIITADANHLPAGVGIHIFRNGTEATFGTGSDPNKGGLCTISNLMPGTYELHIDKSEHDGLHFAPLRTARFEVASNGYTLVPIEIVEGVDEVAITPAARLQTASPNDANKECTLDAGADNSVDPVGDREAAEE